MIKKLVVGAVILVGYFSYSNYQDKQKVEAIGLQMSARLQAIGLQMSARLQAIKIAKKEGWGDSGNTAILGSILESTFDVVDDKELNGIHTTSGKYYYNKEGVKQCKDMDFSCS